MPHATGEPESQSQPDHASVSDSEPTDEQIDDPEQASSGDPSIAQQPTDDDGAEISEGTVPAATGSALSTVTPAADSAQPPPHPTWHERQVARGLPRGMRWTMNTAPPGQQRPSWWRFKARMVAWSYRRWPLPPEPEPEPIPPAVLTAPRQPSAPERELPQAEMPRAVLAPQARTQAMRVDHVGGPGDVVCTTCRHFNDPRHAFCTYCGTALPNAVLAPTPGDLDSPAPEAAEAAPKAKSQPPRRHSRLPWILGIGAVSIIGALIFAFLGPAHNRTTSLIRGAYRSVVEFINPYSGAQAPISSITASSSLEGVSPEALQDKDPRTFWASAPSEDYGAGTTLDFTFARPATIDRIVMNPGIQNQQLSPTALATPAQVTLTFDDGSTTSVYFQALDTNGPFQQVEGFDHVTTQSVHMTIDTVHAPQLLNQQQQHIGEVAISVVTFLETPLGPGGMTLT